MIEFRPLFAVSGRQGFEPATPGPPDSPEVSADCCCGALSCGDCLGRLEQTSLNPGPLRSALLSTSRADRLWVARTVTRLRPVRSPSATDLALTVCSPRSMISRCGSPTRLPDARPHAELAGAARPSRRSQGRRDPGASSRGRRPPPTQPAPAAELGRPRPAQRVVQGAAYLGAPAAARVTENPAALARPVGRPPLDLPT
jgi:hypothetical protein